ncbi:MAG: hypothetical protein HYZ27_09900, partial [Deltaproteobacteria bacterium]|nr:hypothetical protein [Deltaproteobacteria bacterium]
MAAAPEVHDDLRQLISADHGYVQRREELIAKARADSAIATELAAIAKRVDEVSWREAVFAEAILTHMTHPEWVEDVARPSGLVPSVYLKGRPRRPVPLLSLSRMDESAVPLLFELWFKAEELGAYSTDGDFPAALPAAEKSRLRTLEREALPPVILHLVAGRKHAAAPFLIREVALGRPSSLRDTALTALGETQSPVALQ